MTQTQVVHEHAGILARQAITDYLHDNPRARVVTMAVFVCLGVPYVLVVYEILPARSLRPELVPVRGRVRS